MKKTIYHIGMLAAAALAFAGCAKEVDTKQEVGTHTITIIAQADEATKTAIVEGAKSASYKWSVGDEAYFTVKENGVKASAVTMSLNTDQTVATLTATFADPTSAPNEYVYEAFFAKEVSNSGNLKIQATQEPALDSFDPTADLLVAEEQTVASRPATLQFAFRRVVSVNKMTLKELAADEVISSVEISSDKSLAGNFIFASVDKNGDPVEEHFDPSGKKLTLNYGSTAVVPASGEFPVYFVCIPAEGATIGVRVVTDKNVYERNNFTSTVDFKVGVVKRFGVKLGGYGNPVQTGKPYSLVQSNTGIVSGASYLIVGSKDVNNVANYYAIGAQANNNRSGVLVPSPVNNVITIDNTIEAYPVKIVAQGNNYYIIDDYASSDKYGWYIYNASSDTKSYVRSEENPDTDSKAEWSISISNGVATIVNASTLTRNTLSLNYNNGSPLFNVYVSGNTGDPALALYIDASSAVPVLATPTITAGATGNSITVLWDDVANADSYLVTCTGQNNKSVNPGVEEATFTGLADGQYTVTVTAISNDHTVFMDSAPASETVQVGQPALAKPVISSFKQTATGFSATISAAVEHAESYDWTLYYGPSADGDVQGSGNTTSLSFEVPFSEIQSLNSFDEGEDYYLTITAKATGYTSATSDDAFFTAVAPADLYDFSTIAQLNALVASTSATYNGYLTNAIVSFTPSTDTRVAIVKDATGSVMFYKKDIELLQGQTYTGEIEVTALLYTDKNGNSLYSEVTDWDATFTGSQAAVAPQSLSLADLIGHYNDFQNAYVSVAGLTVSAIDNKNITVSDGTNTYIVYYNPGTPACAVGDVITAVGTITKYGTTEELKVWAATDLTITSAAPKAVTFSQPTSGGSFTVKAGNNTINSGDTVASGTIVTLTATPAQGYAFGMWTVTGATVADASSATTTFTMGTSPVSISATFGNSAHPNDGTIDYPYSASEARALALNGDTGSYYIYGTITKIQNQYSAGYGTANFWIDENGTSQTVFEGYKIKYFNNQDWVDGNAQLAVNDEVVIYGTLTVYNTSTPETSSGYLVSVNGVTKGLTLAAPTVTANSNTKQITVSWSAATGTTSAISYVVTCGTQTYNATAAGSHTFTMTSYGLYVVNVTASASDALSASVSANATISDPNSNTKDYYKLVTSVDDITAGTYVVGALRSTSVSNNFYFAKASVSSGDWVVSDNSVTVAEANGVRRFEIANLPSGAVEFTLTGDNTNGFTISNGSNYLYFTEAANRKLAFAAAGSSQKWKVVAKDDPLIAGGVVLSAVGSQAYTISENSTGTGAIRGYANTTKYRAIYLFKKVNE